MKLTQPDIIHQDLHSSISSSSNDTHFSSDNSSQTQKSQNILGTTSVSSMTTLNSTSNTNYSGSTIMVTQNVYSVPGYLCKNYLETVRNQKPLDRGSQGLVLLADLIDQSLIGIAGYKVIVKTLNKGMDQLLEREKNVFYQEIAIIHYFNQTPGFVRLFGYCETPACMLLKYYELGSMVNLIKSKKQFIDFQITKRFLLAFLSKLSLALQALHNSGFVHCDLKPGNILLEMRNNEVSPVLADFGIACVVESKVLKVKAMVFEQLKGFSVAYAAPEQILQARKRMTVPLQPKSMKARDSYAVAGLIYALFHRQDPWHAKQ